jgi:hypothetical protein
MRKQFAKLSKAQQGKVESEYHRMKPEDFDEAMVRAKTVRPAARSKSTGKSKATEKRRAA